MQNERGEQCNHDGHGRRDHAVAERAEKLEMAFRLSGKLQPAFGRGALPDGHRVLPFILLGGKVLYPESGLREVLETNYRRPIR